MHPVLKLLGRNVRRLRLAADMAPEHLAKKADISVYVLDRIETGKGNPGINVVFRLARAIGVQPNELLMEASQRSLSRRN